LEVRESAAAGRFSEGEKAPGMGYRSLRECVEDLQRMGDLRVIEAEVDPRLELGMIQRRAYRSQGPALLFSNLKGCRFPALANLYGTPRRARFVLRHGFRAVQAMVALKADPEALLRSPLRLPLSLARLAAGGWHALPVPVAAGRAPVLAQRLDKHELPGVVSWPRDGGPFVTLPAVYTQSPGLPWWRGFTRSNLGMYRCQLGGNLYAQDEVGLHYQIHRGIGLHHQEALRSGRPLAVEIAVGGPPALALSAVMPLPEGLPELIFAGVLGGRGVRLAPSGGELPILAEADFVILGQLQGSELKPEGPFGDHLGYYSLSHDFPVLRVTGIHARKDAIWPFTTVGRPPQEDTVLGEIIHELAGPALGSVLPGVKGVNAVDEAGVHPLLLAIASERYEPYRKRKRPQEILTAANAILGFGQLSLAKYLLIVAGEDDPGLAVSDSKAVFRHLLQRVDWARDLHFQTHTTVDTLDYSGSGFQEGSKLVIAACGDPLRELPQHCPIVEQGPFAQIRVVAPGILALSGPDFPHHLPRGEDPLLGELSRLFGEGHPARDFPLWVVTEQASYLEGAWQNFLWVTFTRSDPATDVYGLDSFTRAKHWGCGGPLVIDARKKPHHAPELAEDPALVRKIEAMAAPGGSLHGLF
jgi:4-hydroxy-3-polyprenylbenzoate decarboxylase